MISHSNPKVGAFLDWVYSYYGVRTRALSTVWWGRWLQKTKFFKMAAIQLGKSIWINDVDKDHDGVRDYWNKQRPFSCIALVAHELWHVLQKRDSKLARWRYLSPQIYSIFTLIPLTLSLVYGVYYITVLSVGMLLAFLLPMSAPDRLLQEAEAYSWNRYVAALLCDNHKETLQLLESQRASLLCSAAYYYPTRNYEEARSYLVRCERIPYTESALQVTVKQTVEALRNDIK